MHATLFSSRNTPLAGDLYASTATDTKYFTTQKIAPFAMIRNSIYLNMLERTKSWCGIAEMVWRGGEKADLTSQSGPM